jgi:para-aminobenzoate synthetase
VVLLDGAYSARPELADLFSLRVLLDADREVRRARLLQREGDTYRAEWEARWGDAEDHYFGAVMPHAAFDLVLTIP